MQYIGTDVSQTQNAYLAMKGVLTVLDKEDRLRSLGTLWIPGMGTMIGRMSYPTCAKQVLSAIADFGK